MAYELIAENSGAPVSLASGCFVGGVGEIFSARDIKEGMSTPEQANSTDAAKRRAAVWAASQVEDGMKVGLGTGSTSALVIEEGGRRVAEGLRITAIATSEASANQALVFEIPMRTF